MKTLTTFILAGALALLAQPNQLDLRQDPPTAVQSERVSSAYTGTSGATTYYYWVVTRYPIGFIVPTSPVIVGGASALGGGNSVALGWPAMTGASSYDVLRTTTNAAPSSCTCAVVLATTGTTLTDNGGALSAWPPGGLNSAGVAQAELQINNRDAGAPYITMAVRNAQRTLNYQLGILKNGPTPSYVPSGFIQPYANQYGRFACVDSAGADCLDPGVFQVTCLGVDDTALLATAMASGSIVQFPPGGTCVTTTVLIPVANTKLVGNGATLTFPTNYNHGADNNKSMLIMIAAANVEVSGLRLNGKRDTGINWGAALLPLIYVSDDAASVVIEGNYFTNSRMDFVELLGSVGHFPTQIKILNNIGLDAGRDHYVVINGSDIVISGNLGTTADLRFIDLESDSATDVISNVIVSNNQFTDATGADCFGAGVGPGTHSNMLFVDNICTTLGVFGGGGGAGTADRLSIVNNQFYGTAPGSGGGYAFTLWGEGGLTDCKILGNTFKMASGNVGGLWLRSPQRCDVGSNSFTGIGGTAVLTDDPYTATDPSVTISNNTFRSIGGTYAIYAGVPAVVQGNVITSAASVGITVVGADSVISGNKVTASNDCVQLSGARVVADGGVLSSCGQYGIKVTAADITISNVTITSPAAPGIYGQSATNLTVRGAKIISSAQDCLYLDAGSTGGRIFDSEVRNCGTVNSSGILLAAGDTVLDNVRSYDNRGGSASQWYGVRLTAGTGYSIQNLSAPGVTQGVPIGFFGFSLAGSRNNGLKPVVASGFGTSAAVAANATDDGGKIDIGTGGSADVGVLTFGGVYTNAPACTAQNETTALLVKATSTVTTLTLVSASAWTANDIISWTCTFN